MTEIKTAPTTVQVNTTTTATPWYWRFMPTMLVNLASWTWKPTSPELLQSVEQQILKQTGLELEQTLVPAGDHKINTIKIGNGPPLVLLHGFGAGIGFWLCNLKALSQNHTVYAIDLPGFGRSSRHPFRGKSAEEAEEFFLSALEQWRDEMKIQGSFDLLGHSFGAYLASAYALKHPQHVHHLILADPWGIPVRNDANLPRKIPLKWKILRTILTAFNPLTVVRVAGPFGPTLISRFRKDIEDKFQHIFPDTSVISQYIYHLNAQHPSGEMAFALLNETLGWAKYPMINRLPQLHQDVPVTLLYGTSSWMDKEAGLQLKEILGIRAKYFIVPQSGHHIYADNYEFFNTTVVESMKAAREFKKSQPL